MTFILSLPPAALLTFLLHRMRKGKKTLLYGLVCLFSLAGIPLFFISPEEPPFFWEALRGILSNGGLAGALFLLVMFAGALPNGSRGRKLLMPLRGNLSLLGGILVLSHGACHGSRRFVNLFRSPGDLRLSILLASLSSLVLGLLFIPLFVTSVPRLQKAMGGKRWKKLQRLAYPFYGLFFAHILLFSFQGAREGKPQQVLTFFVYSLLGFTYLELRLARHLRGKGKEGWLPLLTFLCQLGFGLSLLACLWPGAAGQGQAAAEAVPVTYADGTYKGASIGYNGRLKVAVTVEDGKIAQIRVKSHVEDEPYITRATKVFDRMIEAGTPQVDIVATATTTSEAFIDAVKQALKEAQIEGEENPAEEEPETEETTRAFNEFDLYEEDYW